MKSLVELLEYLSLDCGRKCAAPVSRDIKTIRERVEHEGDSFITITLPRFCRDFERSLDIGRLAPGSFLSFGKTRSGIPAFLQGFLRQVFDQDGVLVSHPSIDCIRAVRQICLFGKKILRKCSSEREKDAIDEFRNCDHDLMGPPEDQLGRWFKYTARIVCEALDLDNGAGKEFSAPSHGPGATEERISGNQKWVFRRWHRRLEEEGFTFLLYGRAASWPSATGEEDYVWPKVVEPENEMPVRVVLVPKTLTNPRVIAVEPVCMQFAQQALSRFLVSRLERVSLTKGHVNFRDQTVNQGLALFSSGDGHLATLDMKEASDRVSLAHVQLALGSVPRFLGKVLAARSTRARLPNGEVIPLKKFSSMGSALCFPIEALVFFTSIIASRLHRAGLFPTKHSVHSFGRDVYVYGDDLIVPAAEAAAISDDLEALKFRVNRPKSFWTGKFRESCGWDCYDNEQVTPVYLRRDLPRDRRDVSGILSSVSTANQLEKAGYHLTAAAIRKAVEAILGQLPQVSEESPALGWWHHSEVLPLRRWNQNLQRFEYRCWTTVSPRADDPLEGDPALAKCFRLIKGSWTWNQPGDEPLTIDRDHLLSSPRPYSLTLKRKWVPAPL